MPLPDGRGDTGNIVCPFWTLTLFNEWHSANTSKKIKAVFTANAKAGKYKCTYAAYGYEKGGADGKTPVIDEYAASIVRRIFEMRAKGYNPKKIADVLNAEKVLTPSDYRYQKLGKMNPHYTCHLWGNQNIKQILHNPIYLGKMAQLRTTTVSHKNHKVIQKDESDWAVVEGTHEPIIMQELWDMVREVDRSASRGKRSKVGEVKPLSGFLYCADCGAKMRLNNGNQYGTKPAYTCGMYARAGKQYCGSHYIKLYLIEDIILSDIRSMIGLTVDEDNARAIFLKRKLGFYEKQTAADTKKLREIEKRLAELDTLIQSVYEDKVIGKIPEEVCVNLLEKYQQEKTSLQNEMRKLTARAETEKQDERDVDEFIKRLKKYAGAEQLTREMCFELIEYVTVGELTKKKEIPREIHIYYKFLDNGLTNKLNALL